MREKFFSLICTFSLTLNSVYPILSVSVVSAQEVTETSALSLSPSPTETNPPPGISPTVEAQPISLPTDTPTPESSLTPTQEPEATPTVTPDISPSTPPTPTLEIQPTSTDSPGPTSAPENTPSASPNETNNQPNAPPEISPTPFSSSETPTPPVSPTPVEGQLAKGNLSAIIVDNATAQSLQLDFTTQSDATSASLNTDKADYHPTETVIITGSNFSPEKEFSLVITADNYRFETTVKTDGQGNFIYSHPLDSIYRPSYKIEIYDLSGTLLAMTTFTDSINYTDSNDTAGANDEPGQKDLTRLGRDLASTDPLLIYWNWDMVAMSGNNTADACALFDTNNNGLANYSLCVTWNGNQNQSLGSPTLYSCNDTRTDRCAGSLLVTTPISSTCSVANATDDPFPEGDSYNNDTKATCSIPLNDVGGAQKANLLDVCSYPSVQPNSDPSDCIIIRPDKGTLTILKDVVPDNTNTNWNFAVSGPLNFNFSISGDGTSGINSLDLGTYSVTETAGSNTSLSDYNTTWSCTKNGSSYLSGSGTTASNIVLAKNGNTEDSVICTFTNTLNQGSLTVIKHVVGGTAVASDWTMHVNNTQAQDVVPSFPGAENPGTSVALISGSYNVTESGGSTDYSLSYSGDCDSGGNVSLAIGATKTCTLTNTRDTGTIVVHKDVQGPNGEEITDTSSLFTVKLDNSNSQTLTDGGTVTYSNIPTGLHTITEDSPPAGYDFFQMIPDSDSGISGAQINVSSGQTIDVYVTNRQQKTRLTLVKTVVNDNGGTKQVSDFTLKIDGNPVTSGTTNEVSAGLHNTSEVNLQGYTASSWGGDCNPDGTITLSLGGNKTCTITNNDTPAHLIVIKNVVNDDGGNALASNFTMTINGVTALGGNSFPGANSPGTNKILTTVGSYSVTESGPGGYLASYTSDCSGTISLGETKTCTITNNDVAPTITLIKEVINNNGGLAGPDDFGLSIEGQTVLSGDANAVQANLPLALNETVLSGYSFVSITGNPKCPTRLGGTLTLDEGENVICTITNDDIPPTLTLIKSVTNDSGGQASASDWTLEATGPTTISGPGPQVQSGPTFEAGTYTLSESDGPSGYSPSNWVCLGGTQSGDQISLNPGENATCTINNNDRSGTLIVSKVVINDNGGGLEPNDFSFRVNNGSPISFESDGQNTLTVDAGTYHIIEPAVTGYSTSYNNCSNVVIPNGDIQICTITNDDQPGKISGKKFYDLDGDHLLTNGSTDPNLPGWTITLDKQDDINPPLCSEGTAVGELCVKTTNSFGNYTFSGLTPGVYIVSEVLQDGWTQTRPGFFDGFLYGGQGAQADGTYILTIGSGTEIDDRNFGNRGNLSITACKFEDSNGPQDGGELTEVNYWDFTLDNQIAQNTGESHCLTFTDLTPGQYTISENPLPDGWFLADNTNGTQAVTLTSQDQTVNFYNFRQGRISGLKWNDLDGNGGQDCFDEGGEFCELGLEGWTIFLDENNNGTLDDGEDFQETGEDGFYTFSDLDPDTYRVCEEGQNGWIQTFPNSQELNNCYEVIVSSDEDVQAIDFGNQGRGTITVHKNLDNDADGQVDDVNSSNWTWDIDGQGNFTTGDTSQSISAGAYTISEDHQDGYHVTNVECNGQPSGSVESLQVNVEAGESLDCTFTNTRDHGSITIIKNLDLDGDSQADETNAQGWTFDIAGGDQDNPIGVSKSLPTGTYTISEDAKPDYQLLSWNCTNQSGSTNAISLEVTNDSETTCTFLNQLLPPVLNLTKTNNKTGIDTLSGTDVIYTLTVTLTGSPLSGVSLIDLPPAGFKYRLSSWTAFSSVRGDLKTTVTTEPTYASPGTWILGDMIGGEVITLTYRADIDGSIDPGLHKDLAWSKGTALSGTILANANTGFFVGTEVNVVKNDGSSASFNVERREKRESQVLGASTSLPATGANTLWIVFATLLLFGGTGFTWKGVHMRKRHE